MKYIISAVILTFSLFILSSCEGEILKAKTTLSMKQVEPPFTKITPTGLKGASSSRTAQRGTEACPDCPDPVDVIKGRFSAHGVFLAYPSEKRI